MHTRKLAGLADEVLRMRLSDLSDLETELRLTADLIPNGRPSRDMIEQREKWRNQLCAHYKRIIIKLQDQHDRLECRDDE
jgi:hypothetical protein